MTGRTHDLAAFTGLVIAIAYIPALPTMSLATAITAFGANFLGGLFPDIDQPTSDFWDNFRLGPLMSKIICPILGGHRHISHSLVGVVLIGGLTYLFLQMLSSIVLLDMTVVWCSFMIGMVSHLVMDAFTKEGLPLFWPVMDKVGFPPIKALRIQTGKLVEKIVVFPALLILTGYIIYFHQSTFITLLHQYVK